MFLFSSSVDCLGWQGRVSKPTIIFPCSPSSYLELRSWVQSAQGRTQPEGKTGTTIQEQWLESAGEQDFHFPALESHRIIWPPRKTKPSSCHPAQLKYLNNTEKGTKLNESIGKDSRSIQKPYALPGKHEYP